MKLRRCSCYFVHPFNSRVKGARPGLKIKSWLNNFMKLYSRKYRAKQADEQGLPLAGRMWSRVCCISMAIKGSKMKFLFEWIAHLCSTPIPTVRLWGQSRNATSLMIKLIAMTRTDSKIKMHHDTIVSLSEVIVPLWSCCSVFVDKYKQNHNALVRAEGKNQWNWCAHSDVAFPLSLFLCSSYFEVLLTSKHAASCISVSTQSHSEGAPPATAQTSNLKCFIDFLPARPGDLIANDQVTSPLINWCTKHLHHPWWNIDGCYLRQSLFPFCPPVTVSVFVASFLSAPSFTQEELCRCKMTQWSLSGYWCLERHFLPNSFSLLIQSKLREP